MILDALLGNRAIKTTGGSPRNPQFWVQRLFGGGGQGTASGIVINEETALSISAFFDGVGILSDTLGGLPWPVFRQTADGEKSKAREHPLWQTLNVSPNPAWAPAQLKRYTEACRILWGNGYLEIERRPGGVIWLWPLHPTQVEIRFGDKGEVLYRVHRKDGTTDLLFQHEIFHVKGRMTRDGFTGKSAIAFGRESLGLTVAAESYGANFFGNDATPNGIVRFPKPLGESGYDNFKREWKATHGGADGTGLPAILDNGGEWQSIGMPNEDIQFLQTRVNQVLEMCRWLNIQPHLVKALENAHFKNITESQVQFATMTMRPNVTEWEQEADLKLLTGPERRTMFTEFNLDGLMRGDPKTQAENDRIRWETGTRTIDEIRRTNNENLIGEAEGGNLRFVPSNFTTIKQIMNPPEPAPVTPPGNGPPPTNDSDKPDDDDGNDDEQQRRVLAFAPVLQDAFKRLARKESKRGKWACGKFEGDALRGSILEFYETHNRMVAGTLGPVLKSLAAVTGLRLDAGAICGRQIAESRDALVAAVGRPAQMHRLIEEWDAGKFLDRAERVLSQELSDERN